MRSRLLLEVGETILKSNATRFLLVYHIAGDGGNFGQFYKGKYSQPWTASPAKAGAHHLRFPGSFQLSVMDPGFRWEGEGLWLSAELTIDCPSPLPAGVSARKRCLQKQIE
ncbi:MAG: hypothetical protein HKN14_03645 [Marinicaulis sp.]|nr:hypothetical protein [Marinicaulis sp.]